MVAVSARRAGAMLFASALIASGAGACAAAAVRAASVPDTRLSDEWTHTTWAYALSPAHVYARPDSHSRRVAQLQPETAAGLPGLYVLLALHVDRHGRRWVRLRVPGRPNGRTGWVLRTALGMDEHTRWVIVVHLRSRRLAAYLRGRLRFRAPVGVGKPSTPTPTGHFWISEILPVPDRASPYWPYVLGTSDYSTLSDWPGGGIVGIHGDFGEPQRIPGDPSHGCIRMHDADIAWLAEHVSLGTPVVVR